MIANQCESEGRKKLYKCLDNAKEMKKLMNSDCATICNRHSSHLEKRLREMKIRGKIDTIQITVLVKSVRILKRVVESKKKMSLSKSRKYPSVRASVKKSSHE